MAHRPITIELLDAWFEQTDYGCTLMVAAPCEWPEFHVNMPGASITFRHVANVKGRRLFAASALHPVGGSDQSSPSPLSLLSGPFRRGSRDVA